MLSTISSEAPFLRRDKPPQQLIEDKVFQSCRNADEMVVRQLLDSVVFYLIVVSTVVLSYKTARSRQTCGSSLGKKACRLHHGVSECYLTPALEKVASIGRITDPTLYSLESDDVVYSLDPIPLEESSTNSDQNETLSLQAIKNPSALDISGKLLRDIVALKSFHALHGHFRVPYYYIIPDEANGDFCTNSRIRRKEAVIPPASGIVPSRSLAFIARSIMSEAAEETISNQNRTEDPNIPNNRIPPPKYPKEVIGLQLGRRVAKIRLGELYSEPNQRAQLEFLGELLPLKSQQKTIESREGSNDDKKIGFDNMKSAINKNHVIDNNIANETRSKLKSNLSTLSNKEYLSEMKFLDILSALKIHDKIFGDMLVPRYFRVPFEEPWPARTWGMQLGNRVRNIRAKSAYNKPKFHEILLQSGFAMSIDNFRMPFTSGRSQKDED